jgi:hypothetical protein
MFCISIFLHSDDRLIEDDGRSEMAQGIGIPKKHFIAKYFSFFNSSMQNGPWQQPLI